MICKTYYLGGIKQEGSTCLVLEFEKNLLIFNFGRDVVPNDILGVSRQVPDFTQLIKKLEQGYKILGLFINSFSIKYIGGIPNLISEIPKIPIYCSKTTGSILRKYIELKTNISNININNVESSHIYGLLKNKKTKLWEINKLKKRRIDNNLVDSKGNQYYSFIFPFNTLSRAIGSLGYYVRLQDQAFCITGEFIFGPRFSKNAKNDINALTQISNYPILLLTCAGENLSRNEYTYPTNLISSLTKELLVKNTKTIVAAIDIEESTMFVEIINLAKQFKRNVILNGKSIRYHYNTYLENGDIILKNSIKVINKENAKSEDYKNAIVIYSDTFDRLIEKIYDDLIHNKDAKWKEDINLLLILVQYLPLREIPLQNIIAELAKSIERVELLTKNGFTSANASFYDWTMFRDIVRFQGGYIILENSDDKVFVSMFKKLKNFKRINLLNVDNFEILTFTRNVLDPKWDKLKKASEQTYTLVGNHKIGSRVLRKRRNLSSEGVAMITVLKSEMHGKKILRINFKSAGVFSTLDMSGKIKMDMENELKQLFNNDKNGKIINEEEQIYNVAKKIIKKTTKKIPEIKVHIFNRVNKNENIRKI